ncbi:GTP-binding protein like [Actinidia chinensis var. chinensis]|uniref:GTP-binding protein ERG n=1 Tax=Actinidia chinensis var. chinensis TaxID=1590841 RepID=A0A2R6QVM2_ACTCC|nr:GTP-binding protein like [Actinidia chinensis var. chinensis]
MKALRALRTLAVLSSSSPSQTRLNSPLLRRFYAAQPQEVAAASASASEDDENGDSVFDSSQYTLPDMGSDSVAGIAREPTWDEKYREKANREIFGEETQIQRIREKEEEKKRRAAALAKALLEAALARPDEEEEEGDSVVKEEDQKSLSVGIIGAPNAGKSALTNFMVGTKVAAVSRKTNTTTHEVLGVMTEGNTQICFFDTPGLTLNRGGFPYNDMKVRVESAWSSVGLYDVLIVIFDVHRHLNRPDSRVVKLINRMGAIVNPKQKRVLCMNKVDLVEKKKDLLKVAEQFKDLPGYEKYFMISGLKGSGVKHLTQYLMEQAVKRPWDEDPLTMSEEVMKAISLEVVREKLLDHVHQEIPYGIEHRLVDWKEFRDGSLRIEQHFITHKMSQRKILVGKKGSKIGRIGLEANEELRSIFKKTVHLILQVRLK